MAGGTATSGEQPGLEGVQEDRRSCRGAVALLGKDTKFWRKVMVEADFWTMVVGEIRSIHDYVLQGFGWIAAVRTPEWNCRAVWNSEKFKDDYTPKLSISGISANY